ncbi:MAG: hypothetical protein KIT20_14510 [Alphaproteobacteria bacterium]|nr:hypothetical protein [Alphaproteobacteria bacterium]
MLPYRTFPLLATLVLLLAGCLKAEQKVVEAEPTPPTGPPIFDLACFDFAQLDYPDLRTAQAEFARCFPPGGSLREVIDTFHPVTPNLEHRSKTANKATWIAGDGDLYLWGFSPERNGARPRPDMGAILIFIRYAAGMVQELDFAWMQDPGVARRRSLPPEPESWLSLGFITDGLHAFAPQPVRPETLRAFMEQRVNLPLHTEERLPHFGGWLALHFGRREDVGVTALFDQAGNLLYLARPKELLRPVDPTERRSSQ